MAWERELAAGGWVGLSWPASVGGREASLHERLIFDEEYVAAEAPARAGFFGEQLLGPTMIIHGTDEQKRRFLPAILRGDEFWCQGYSEPGAGSDLANVATRAVRDGGDWVIDGQKVWTSLAQFADWIFVLCRTDPDAPRHRGLSLLLCPLDQPGVEVRPIRQLTGEAEFNEVFFDGARTRGGPWSLGDGHDGWRVAMSVLGFERGTAFLAQQRDFVREYDAVVDVVRRRGGDGRSRRARPPGPGVGGTADHALQRSAHGQCDHGREGTGARGLRRQAVLVPVAPTARRAGHGPAEARRRWSWPVASSTSSSTASCSRCQDTIAAGIVGDPAQHHRSSECSASPPTEEQPVGKVQ